MNEPQNTEELPVTLWTGSFMVQKKFPDFTRPQKLPSFYHVWRTLLLCSPTGSGKTLTAFLTIIDRLIRLAMENKLEDRVYCTCISPIKALANDIQKSHRSLSKLKTGTYPIDHNPFVLVSEQRYQSERKNT